MKPVTLGEFAEIVGGEVEEAFASITFANVSAHSKHITTATLFIALRGSDRDGHQFVAEAFANGAVGALVARAYPFLPAPLSEPPPSGLLSSGSLLSVPLIRVEDPLTALRRFAAYCRDQIAGKVVAVTGSNGKTLVKDALFAILSTGMACEASPGSFNSQLGVSLSLIRLQQNAEVNLLEAGVSQTGEMALLEQMLRPHYGILTNVGWAHIASFGSRAQIAAEKTLLFRNIPVDGWILVPFGDPLVEAAIAALPCRVFRFGEDTDALPFFVSQVSTQNETLLHIRFPGNDVHAITVATRSQEALIDIFIAICAAHLLGTHADQIVRGLQNYLPAVTRREIWKTPTGVTLISDTYNSEPLAILSALHELNAIGVSGRRFFVFGGMEGMGAAEEEAYAKIGKLAAQSGVNDLLLIGNEHLTPTMQAFQEFAPEQSVRQFTRIADAREYLLSVLSRGDTVLVKAAGSTQIDRLASALVEAMAPNRFYVDVQAIEENVARFRSLIGPGVRLLAMVKALAYGSDSTRLALELQEMGVDSLGVSSADEGSALRMAGVTLPILVMMCAPDEIEKLVRHDLTPVLYSFAIAQQIVSYLDSSRLKPSPLESSSREMRVHIEIDTGLGRLGITPNELPALLQLIQQTGHIRVEGVMTHFASAEMPEEDDFTRSQMQRFEDAKGYLNAAGLSPLIFHAGATAGAIRFPDARYDMVRVGLGLYGISPSEAVRRSIDLVPAIALVSRIVTIQIHKRQDRIGYNGTFVVPFDGFRKAILPIGYHDGMPVSASGRGWVLIDGHKAPICGRVSMDSLAVDVTDIPDADVGSDALLYGSYGGHLLHPEEVAARSQTIVYELLARLGPRVQRIFRGR